MLPFIDTFLTRKYKPTRRRFSMKTPHTIIMPGSFMVLTVNFGSCCDALLRRPTIFGTPLTVVKVVSSPNIPFPLSAAVIVDISGKS